MAINSMTRRIFLFCVFFGLAAMGRPPSEGVRDVYIDTAAGGVHLFAVEIADSERSRARGLMFRSELGANEGMLFLFPRERRLSFWMKDTPLPLDIIFIDKDGTIVHIARDTTPFSLKPIPSQFPAISALEVNAGKSEELGIAVGDIVRHPYFHNSETSIK